MFSSSQKQALAEMWGLHCRRVYVSMAATSILSEMEVTARKHPFRMGIYKPRRKIVREGARNSVSFESVTARLTYKEFRAVFRMTRIDFYKLLELVREPLTKDVEMGRRGGNGTVLPAKRLAITLRMLAGARYRDLMLLYGISQPTVYKVFHDTVDALTQILKLPLLPETDEGLRHLADGMKNSRSRGNPLSGCIGALDGICIKIQKPRADLNPALFYCRKGYYAIPVQALVDYSYRFLCASANCAGSTHNSLAHSSSKLGQYLMRGLLGKPYYIAGDEAYICTEHLLTPCPASQAEGFLYRVAFNFFLSSMRMHVEQAFGMLKAKWLILDDLKFGTEVCSSLIILTMKLHNYCLDQGGRYTRSRNEARRIREEAEEWYQFAKRDDFDRVDQFGRCSTFGEPTEANFADAASLKREHFVALLEAAGLERPVVFMP